MQDVIRMTYDAALCHPDEITKIWSLSHPDDLAIPSISSGWLIVDTLCHPDYLPGVGISSGWVTANSLCHPDDILHFMSSGWGWFLIRISYDNVVMSSGWHRLPFLSHLDEIANFDFPHHAVALQRFRTFQTHHRQNITYSKFTNVATFTVGSTSQFELEFLLFPVVQAPNLALNKPAYQSSAFNGRAMGVFRELFGEKWTRDIRSTLYIFQIICIC